MHRVFPGQVHSHRPELGFDHIKVAVVGFEVDAAVDDMDIVGVAGDGDGVAAVAEFVDAAGAGAHIVGVVGNRVFLEIDDRQGAGFAIANQQAAVDFDHFLSVVITVMAVVMVGFRERQFDQFRRFQSVGDYRPHGAAAGLVDYGVD